MHLFQPQENILCTETHRETDWLFFITFSVHQYFVRTVAAEKHSRRNILCASMHLCTKMWCARKHSRWPLDQGSRFNILCASVCASKYCVQRNIMCTETQQQASREAGAPFWLDCRMHVSFYSFALRRLSHNLCDHHCELRQELFMLCCTLH